MSNKKKFEKNISKKLKKLYAAAKLNPSEESRLLFVSGKYGFSVICMEEVPGSGRSFVDSTELVMNKTVARALTTSNTDKKPDIGRINARIVARLYDGHSLANSFDAKRDVIPSSVDYAKMQGIDLDEAADRQRDNYVDHPDGRKAVVTQTNAGHIGLDVKRLYDKAVEERMKLKQELNEAHDKAAEDYKKIKELEDKLAEMTKTINDEYAKNAALQKDMDGTMAQLNSIKEERDRLQKFYDNAESKDADVDANEAAEELATVSDVFSIKSAVEALTETSKEPEAQPVTYVKEPTDDYEMVIYEPFDLPVHKDELPDDCMLTLLQNTKKPYNLRTIFKLQSNIYEKIEPAVYMSLIGIRDPRTTNVRNFSRTAYAAAIALSVSEGYVGSFMRRLIDDYSCGNFIPTDPKYLPEDFPNFLKSLYPDIARIHCLLHTDARKLPYVCKKNTGNVTEYFTVGPRPYDNPSEIRDTEYYIAIPKFANPYDFLEYDKTKELVMIFNCYSPNNRRRPIQDVMNDTDAAIFRDEYDNISYMRYQINRYISADEAGLIDLGCNNPDEILRNKLWFYPVVCSWSVRNYPTDVPTKISSESKHDPNEK